MIAANFSDLRKNLKKYLDDVENGEILIVKRSKGNGTVTISLDAYNSIKETEYLLASAANASWLRKSIKQYNEGKTLKKKLIEANEP